MTWGFSAGLGIGVASGVLLAMLLQGPAKIVPRPPIVTLDSGHTQKDSPNPAHMTTIQVPAVLPDIEQEAEASRNSTLTSAASGPGKTPYREDCIRSVLADISDREISDETLDAIFDNGSDLSAALQSDAAALRAVEQQIANATDAETIMALGYLLSDLPPGQAFDALSEASRHSPEHARIAMDYIASLDVSDPGLAGRLEGLLASERNPAVLSALLDAYRASDGSALSEQGWRHLDQQFSTQSNPSLRGDILKTMVVHGGMRADDLMAQIEIGLADPSSDLQAASLAALSDLNAAQDDDMLRDYANWSAILDRANAIASDPDARPALRIEALEFLETARE